RGGYGDLGDGGDASGSDAAAGDGRWERCAGGRRVGQGGMGEPARGVHVAGESSAAGDASSAEGGESAAPDEQGGELACRGGGRRGHSRSRPRVSWACTEWLARRSEVRPPSPTASGCRQTPCSRRAWWTSRA